MRVGEIMARHVEFIPADAPVSEAAELMGELEVGALPVGTAEDLLGVVTDRDILEAIANGARCIADVARVTGAGAKGKPTTASEKQDVKG